MLEKKIITFETLAQSSNKNWEDCKKYVDVEDLIIPNEVEWWPEAEIKADDYLDSHMENYREAYYEEASNAYVKTLLK